MTIFGGRQRAAAQAGGKREAEDLTLQELDARIDARIRTVLEERAAAEQLGAGEELARAMAHGITDGTRPARLRHARGGRPDGRAYIPGAHKIRSRWEDILSDCQKPAKPKVSGKKSVKGKRQASPFAFHNLPQRQNCKIIIQNSILHCGSNQRKKAKGTFDKLISHREILWNPQRIAPSNSRIPFSKEIHELRKN